MQAIPFVRGVSAALAAGAVILMAGATPAWAADQRVTVTVPDLTVPISEGFVVLIPTYRADPAVTLRDTTVTFELGDELTGVSLSPSDHAENVCRNESPAKLVCSDPTSPGQLGPAGVYGLFAARVTAGAGAVVGESGGVTVSFTTDGRAPVVSHGKIRVAEEVGLVAAEGSAFYRDPGQAVTEPLTVGVIGKNVAAGAAVRFTTDFAYAAPGRYSNCLYAGGRPTACVFDGDLQPGASYTASMPYTIRKDTEARSHALNDLTWSTPDQLTDYRSYLRQNGYPSLGSPGTGAKLELKKVTAAAHPALQADPNAMDNTTRFQVIVGGSTEADLVALGAKVKGKAGDVVSATVGARNDGPAVIDTTSDGYPPAWVDVSTPPGTTVVGAPVACWPLISAGNADPEKAGEPGFSKYSCFGDRLLTVGARQQYTFKLRIDTVKPGAKGTVVLNDKCDCQRSQYDRDLDLTNNTTAIIVNAKDDTGTGGSAGGAGATAGGSGNGGTGGGELPKTGPAGSIWIVGVALLVAGVATMLFTRQKRA